MKYEDIKTILDNWWFDRIGCPKHEDGVILNDDLTKWLKKKGITKAQFHKWMWEQGSHNLIYIDGSC